MKTLALSIVGLLSVLGSVRASAATRAETARGKLCVAEAQRLGEEKVRVFRGFAGTTCENWLDPREKKLTELIRSLSAIVIGRPADSIDPNAVNALACDKLLPLSKDLLRAYQAKNQTCHTVYSGDSDSGYTHGYQAPAQPAPAQPAEQPPTGFNQSAPGYTVFGSDGTSYTTNGNTTYGSNGVIYTHTAGPTTIGSNGVIYTTSGNITNGSDGSTCVRSGSQLDCSNPTQ